MRAIAFLSVLVLCAFAGEASAQCAGGACGVVVVPRVTVERTVVVRREWVGQPVVRRGFTPVRSFILRRAFRGV